MSARSDMKMRALVEFSTSPGTDPDGHPQPVTWSTKYAAAPCLYWTTSRMERFTPNEQTVQEQVRIIFPLDLIVNEGDRVADITDRRGNILTSHAYNIRSVEYKVSHQECLLEAVL